LSLNGALTNEDILPLRYMTELTALWVGTNGPPNQITDLSPLAGLTNLTDIYFSGDYIADITPLAGLTNLTWLHIFRNQVADITPLAGLTNLETLQFGASQITDITPLAGLTNLTSLDLSWNHITDITPLAGLTNLHALNLRDNQITDITPLAGLVNLGRSNLTRLYLSNNNISDLTPLAGFIWLESLWLDGNPITDFSSVAHLMDSIIFEMMYPSQQDNIEPIPHVGAAHETQRIVSAMQLPREDMTVRSIQIGADHGGFGYGAYTLTVHYNLHGGNIEYAPDAAFEQISARLFYFIGNLRAVTFSVVGYGETDTDSYIYRWSISRTNSDAGGGASTSFRGIQSSAGPQQGQAEETLLSPIPAGVVTLVNAISIGMERDAVERLFAPSVVPRMAMHAYGSGHSYRYDLIHDSDYIFICPYDMDVLDIEGMQEGRVRLVIFVDYTPENAVERFTIYYSIWDGSIYEVRVRYGTQHHSRIMDGGDWRHDDTVLWG